jgi:Zn-dependent peptidase ImmA (M78 family)
MSIDHKVQARSEKTLARWADDVRKLARLTGRYTFDICDLIERVLVGRFEDKIGLAIVITQGDRHDEPAFVKFRKMYPRVVLNVRRKVWEDAKKGASYAYFVLAHEIAHILFHDHKAVAYTRDASLHIQYALPEDSAEWQADTFAKHLTMPDEALRDVTDATLLGVLCNVEQATATDRIASYLRTGPMHEFSYDGNPCGKCSNFTLVHNGTITRCDTCGNVVHELALGLA